MKPLNYNGKNEWKFASATPPLHFHSFFHQKKRKRKEKMYNFEFKLRSHYTQKGILPKFSQTQVTVTNCEWNGVV